MASIFLDWDEAIGVYTAPTVQNTTTYSLANADGVSHTVFDRHGI